MKTIALSAKRRQEIQDRRRQADDRRIFQRLSALLWIDEQAMSSVMTNTGPISSSFQVLLY